MKIVLNIFSYFLYKFLIFQFQFELSLGCDCELDYYRQPQYIYQTTYPKGHAIPEILDKVHDVVGSSLDLAATAATSKTINTCNNKNIIKTTILRRKDNDNHCNNNNNNRCDPSCKCNGGNVGRGGGCNGGDGGCNGGGGCDLEDDLKYHKNIMCDEGNPKNFYDENDEDFVTPAPLPINRLCRDVISERNLNRFQKNALMKRKMLCQSIARKRNQLAKLTAKLRAVDQTCKT